MASKRKPRRRPHHGRKHTLYLAGLYTGILLILSGLYLSYQTTILSFAVAPPGVGTDITQKALPVRILISRAKINLKIEESQITRGKWQISPQFASHLTTSARPKEGGNIVIYGHNKREVFGALKKVKVDDDITVHTADGKLHNYRVTQIETVTPNDIKWVLTADEEVLTVYTCTGLFDSKRLIIRALPLTSSP